MNEFVRYCAERQYACDAWHRQAMLSFAIVAGSVRNPANPMRPAPSADKARHDAIIADEFYEFKVSRTVQRDADSNIV